MGDMSTVNAVTATSKPISSGVLKDVSVSACTWLRYDISLETNGIVI